jgi:beta-lactamase regulating signal transducer with metallopeptidase domain
MTAVSLEALHALGWTLLHFVWQGAALAALLAAALMVSRNANVRYALGIGTLILMMAAPVVTFAWLNRTPSPTAAVELPVVAGGDLDVVSASDAVSSTGTLVHALAEKTNREDAMLWLVQAWFVGVMLLSVRTAGGLVWLARTRRGEIEPLSEEMYRQCLLLQQRMGLQRHIRYGQSRGLDSPVVIGWFRPVVVVTTQAITGLSPQQLQAIIAHELAHIRRYDAFVNLFQVAAEMFLFYHPAVWWVSRRIRIEREVCCDHEALAACGEPVSYARALTMMEEWRAAPSMLMAANRGPLAERVLRLLGMHGTSARSRVAGLGACVLGIAAALFAGSVFVAAAQATTEEPAEVAVPTPAPAPAPTPAPAATPAPAPQPAVRPRAAVSPKPPVPPRPAQETRRPREDAPSNKTSYLEGIEGAGLPDVTIEQAIAMKVQGITPEYIKGMLATQLHPEVDELIAMKVHGVTPEYIDELRRLVVDLRLEEVVAMKVHGVTPQFIQGMQSSGLDIRLAEDLIAAKVHAITPELVKSAVEHGFQNLTVDKLMMLRNIDVL